MDEKDNGVDRISVLPTFIIHHIMSYLSAKEVAQTSILSKRWKCLQTSFPILDFDQTYFVGPNLTERNFVLKREKKIFRESLKKFMKFVDTSLLQFCESKLCIEKLRLYTSLLNVRRSSSLVNKWIGLAVTNGVRELDINILSDRKTMYALPPIIFSAKLITTLKLGGCKLEQYPDGMRFISLKKLTLDRLCITENMVQKLLSESPLLEDLFISYCRGLKFLFISKTLKLKIMKVYVSSNELERLKIVAPSLEQFTLRTSWTEGPSVIDMAECTHLSKLELMCTTLTDREFHHLISKFPLLEDLSLSNCKFLKTIAISSDQLKNLSLESCSNLKAIDVDAPNLLSFSYEDESIPSCLINAPCPWKVCIWSKGDIDTLWYLKLKEFLQSSNQIEDLRICVRPQDKHSFNLDEFRSSSPSHHIEVENLSLPIYPEALNYPTLLDDCLSICFPKTLSIGTWWIDGSDDGRVFKWLYNQLWNQDTNCCCCNFQCWRHYIKDIKCESLLKTDDPKSLNMDELMDSWTIPSDRVLQFHVDWEFPLVVDKG